MAPPSQLTIATSVLGRLVKEEASYHKELEQQKASIQKLEQGGGDENAEYTLKQERKALEQTEAVFPPLRERIKKAMDRLEAELEAAGQREDKSNMEETTKAKEALSQARASYPDIA